MFDPAAVRARLDAVRERLARAAGRAQRDPSSIKLIAVSKTFSADHVRAAYDAGQLDFGENKVQEAAGKIADTSPLAIRWHLIGHLQSNKAKRAVELFSVIHSVDSEALLARLDASALAAGVVLEALAQVDLAGETTKHGLTADSVRPLFEAGRRFRNVRLAGLMVIPPFDADPEQTRPYFAGLRRLKEELLAHGVEPGSVRELSMGMSHDFEVAVEEGATIIRVGSAIFGERTYV